MTASCHTTPVALIPLSTALYVFTYLTSLDTMLDVDFTSWWVPSFCDACSSFTFQIVLTCDGLKLSNIHWLILPHSPEVEIAEHS